MYLGERMASRKPINTCIIFSSVFNQVFFFCLLNVRCVLIISLAQQLKGKIYDEITGDFSCILITSVGGGLIKRRIATH